MKFTKELMQKIKGKYQGFTDGYFDGSKIEEFVQNHPELKFDVNNFENNEDMIEFMALSLAVVRDKSSHRGKIIKAEAITFSFDGNTEGNFLRLLDNVDQLDDIEEIDDGKVTFLPEQKIHENDEPNGLENGLVDTNLFTVNDIFNQRTMLLAQDNMGKNQDKTDRIGKSLINYEKDKNNKISISEAINLKLQNLSTTRITTENLRDKQNEAAELLSIYAALEERSEKRTFIDILKHPFKTFGEWLAKGKVKDTLKERYDMNDKQLSTMSNLVRKEIVPKDYKSIGKDGEIFDSLNNQLIFNNNKKRDLDASIGDRGDQEIEDMQDELDYDQLSADSSFSSEISEKSEFHEEKQIDNPSKSIDEKNN